MELTAIALVVLLCLQISNAGANPIYEKQKENPWFLNATLSVQQKAKSQPILKRAKNVILFLGDGMGVSTVTAARILDGQLKGMPGEENTLSWEKFPYTALSKTYNVDYQVADSAGTATAFLTGVKTKLGSIGVNEAVDTKDCESGIGNEVLSILELAEMNNLATGIVTTSRVTDATPASAYAHTPSRKFEYSTDKAVCKDIAIQLAEFSVGDGLELVMGGGRSMFKPNTSADEEYPDKKGYRTDGKDLISSWLSKPGIERRYVWNQTDFSTLDPERNQQVLGLFETYYMKYEVDRDRTNEPSITEMTEFAIKKLGSYKKGYFLLVEGGLIDLGHHDNDARRALHDTVAFAQAVKRAREMTSRDETLIIVTADHSHTFVLQGYPQRGNPITGLVKNGGKVVLAKDKKPYTSLSYANGISAEINETRKLLSEEDVKQSGFKQQSLVPLNDETHGGEDVPVYADGPQAHLLTGVVEENYIFHVMDYALCLSQSKKNIQCPTNTSVRPAALRIVPIASVMLLVSLFFQM